MKKISIILSTFLSLIMVFGLSSCSNDDNNHTVSFITNGGSAVSTISDEIIECPPACIKEGYCLDGWYYDEELTDKVEFPVLISVDMNFYAKWYKSLDQYKKEFTQKLKTEMKDDDAELIGTTADSMSIFYTYTFEYESDDKSYATNYTANVWLNFEYGDFKNASGQITYNYENKVNGVLSNKKEAFYTVLSLRQTGNNYVLNDGYFLTLSSDLDTEKLLKDFNFYLNLAKGNIRTLSGADHMNTILDYDKV